MLKIEKININNAHQRILAQDIYADKNDPPCNISPIDGIAIKYSDHLNGLWLIDDILIGQNPPKNLAKNECISVSKGAKLPLNCDKVFSLQDTYKKDGQIFIKNDFGHQIIKNGDNYKKGDHLLFEGDSINLKAIISLSKNNISDISVYQKVPVSINIISKFINSSSFELKDYQVRDYVTPYLKSKLKFFYQFEQIKKPLLEISIVSKLNDNYQSIVDESRFDKHYGFVIYLKNGLVKAECTCSESILNDFSYYLLTKKLNIFISI